MPHKHKRSKTSGNDANLPPDTIARPLPVRKATATKLKKSSGTGAAQTHASKKKKRSKPGDDDTPKVFARLMALQNGQKPRSGLDDGTRQRASKKQRITNPAAKDEVQADAIKFEALNVEMPTILPGERMADFSARVDAALPLNGLVSKGNVKLEGVKRNRTRIEKKITRMQDEWRERDKRYREKQAEAEEEAEIEAILNGEDGAKAARILENRTETSTASKKKGKKGKRKKGGEDSDDDPWAALAKSRKAAEQRKGLIGVHDVVQEPPRFNAKPKEKFKIRDGAAVHVSDVPGAAGSLRRREALGETRRNVLETYRSSVKGQRG